SAIYTLSLHDALPICSSLRSLRRGTFVFSRESLVFFLHILSHLSQDMPEVLRHVFFIGCLCHSQSLSYLRAGYEICMPCPTLPRSEEHTSELQSPCNL